MGMIKISSHRIVRNPFVWWRFFFWVTFSGFNSSVHVSLAFKLFPSAAFPKKVMDKSMRITSLLSLSPKYLPGV